MAEKLQSGGVEGTEHGTVEKSESESEAQSVTMIQVGTVRSRESVTIEKSESESEARKQYREVTNRVVGAGTRSETRETRDRDRRKWVRF